MSPTRLIALVCSLSITTALALLSPATAAAQTEVTSGTYTFVLTSTCTGQPITGEGTFHVIATTNVTPSGRVVVAFHGMALARFTDASGGEYISHGATHSVQTYDLEQDSAAHGTGIVVAPEIRIGRDIGDDELVLRSIVTTTVDAQGRWVEFHVHGEVACR